MRASDVGPSIVYRQLGGSTDQIWANAVRIPSYDRLNNVGEGVNLAVPRPDQGRGEAIRARSVVSGSGSAAVAAPLVNGVDQVRSHNAGATGLSRKQREGTIKGCVARMTVTALLTGICGMLSRPVPEDDGLPLTSQWWLRTLVVLQHVWLVAGISRWRGWCFVCGTWHQPRPLDL